MARCPECGSWIWHPPGWFEEHVCPNCGAILKLKGSLGGIFLGNLEVVGHATSRREDYSRLPPESLPQNIERDIGESGVTDDDAEEEEEVPSGDDTADWGQCQYCHAPIIAPNARFCSNCGASLSYGSGEAPTPEVGEEARPQERLAAVTKHEENCIVCSLRLTKDDDVVWCPHCGGLAHRNHMVDWVRAKKCCPACNASLDEGYYD